MSYHSFAIVLQCGLHSLHQPIMIGVKAWKHDGIQFVVKELCRPGASKSRNVGARVAIGVAYGYGPSRIYCRVRVRSQIKK